MNLIAADLTNRWLIVTEHSIKVTELTIRVLQVSADYMFALSFSGFKSNFTERFFYLD